MLRLFFFLLLIFPLSSPAEALRIAVASNFLSALEQIKIRFEQETTHQLLISSGSTGKLYAQIKNGAPYDIFLAADKKRPFLLAANGLADTPQLYALGRLVLWARDSSLQGLDGEACLASFTALGFQKLAIANPKTAPYGLAAEQFLQNADVWQVVQPRLVRGENIGQVLQFSRSGTVEFSLLAWSQLKDKKAPLASCYYLVPAEQHAPIEQFAVLLKRAAEKTAAREFMDFLNSVAVKQLIAKQGYQAID